LRIIDKFSTIWRNPTSRAVQCFRFSFFVHRKLDRLWLCAVIRNVQAEDVGEERAFPLFKDLIILIWRLVHCHIFKFSVDETRLSFW